MYTCFAMYIDYLKPALSLFVGEELIESARMKTK